MKSRNVDRNGRVIIPKKIRKELKFEPYQKLEIIIEYGELCLRKYNSSIKLKNRPYLGIVREMDKYNRIAIPAEYRTLLGLAENTRVHWDADYDEEVIRIWNNTEG